MLQVKKVTGNVLSSNMYIISEERTNDCWLVDIGDYSILKKHLLPYQKIKGVFLTHGHFDHIADINRLIEDYKDCIIYTSEYGKEQLLSAKKNFSFYHEKSTTYNGELNRIRILQDNNKIQLFNSYNIKVKETPGHCPSCLTYCTDNYIFTGDSYIPNTEVVTKLPKGDKIKAYKSIELIKSLSVEKTICPGHDVSK